MSDAVARLKATCMAKAKAALARMPQDTVDNLSPLEEELLVELICVAILDERLATLREIAGEAA